MLERKKGNTTMNTLQLRAPLYAISAEWEHNGYDDSDFYRAMYDPNTDSLQKVETHSTRYGCGHFAVVTKDYASKHDLHGYINHTYNPETRQYDLENGIQVGLPVTWFVMPQDTPERVYQRAEQLLAESIYQLIRSAEHRDILTPENAEQGDVLRLSEAHKSRKAGQTLPVGTRIRVNECTAFGTFYRNGYNHPGRHNRSVVGTVVGHPETLVRVPLAKCRLDQEPMPDEQLRQRAVELAKNRRFEQCWGRVF